MGCKLKNNKTDIMPIKDNILQNINNNFEFVCKIDTKNIKLYSTDPYFYKKVLYNGIYIDVYKNINVKDKNYYLVTTGIKNSYYIKTAMLHKIDSSDNFKEYIIKNMHITEELNLDLLNNFIRDNTKDFIYCPTNADTESLDYPLFYFIDKYKNIIYAYNQNKTTEETLNKFKFKHVFGCLLLLNNTDQKFKCIKLEHYYKHNYKLINALIDLVSYFLTTMVD